MLELYRRLALAAGTGVFLWLFFWSPAALISVSRADFAARMLKMEFIPDGLTVERLRIEQMEDRTLDPSLAHGIALPSPDESRFYDASLPAVAPMARALGALSLHTHGVNGFTTLNGTDYEWTILHQPRASNAPAVAVYPHRASSWPWLAGGWLVFLCLPSVSSRRSVRWDRRALLFLDLITIIFAGAFFAAPLALHGSAAEALSPFKLTTGLAWLACAAILAGLARNAFLAAWSVDLDGERLCVRSLSRKTEYSLAAITQVEVLTRDQIPCGWRLHFSSSPPFDLLWLDRINWRPLAQALGRHD